MKIAYKHHENIKTHLKQNIISSESFPHFFAGLLAGAVECLVGHPMETLRIMTMTKSSKQMSSLNGFMNAIAQSGGVIGLYRGSVSELISTALTSSYVYGLNDVLVRVIGKSMDDEDFEKVDMKLFASAFATGCMDVFFTKPFEMIKLRQQASTSELSHAPFIVRAKTLASEGGILNLYRGWVPTLLRESLGSIAFFAVYKLSKNQLITHFQQQNSKLVSANTSFNYKITNNATLSDSLQLLNFGASSTPFKLSHA